MKISLSVAIFSFVAFDAFLACASVVVPRDVERNAEHQRLHRRLRNFKGRVSSKISSGSAATSALVKVKVASTTASGVAQTSAEGTADSFAACQTPKTGKGAGRAHSRSRSVTKTKSTASKTASVAAGTSTKAAKAKATGTLTTTEKAKATASLDPNAANCIVELPADPLSATGLSTPWILQPPCSQSVTTQQSFAEAAIFDPATNTVSIYHPLIADLAAGVAATPVVPTIPSGATVGIWFGFNGGVLTLADSQGLDTNSSPTLKTANCINGLSGIKNDVFGQVSWCNAEQFFSAVNNKGGISISTLGTDVNGDACPTSRSFTITDACPSDNVPTQYLLLSNGKIAQDTATNRAANSGATVITNASDEALVASILDPLLGCTPFTGDSLDDPGAKVPALALAELQAAAQQAAPIGLVPLNDPDTLLTSNGAVSTNKTNEYRLGVNQPIVTGSGADSGALIPYCDSMVSVQPPFLKKNQALFSKTTSPDTGVGNNLFTFMSNRFLTSLTQLNCTNQADSGVTCTLDGNGAATACTIGTAGTSSATAKASKTAKATTATKSKASKAAKATATKSKASKAAKATSATSAKATAKKVMYNDRR